jgi:hypothetical protein
MFTLPWAFVRYFKSSAFKNLKTQALQLPVRNYFLSNKTQNSKACIFERNEAFDAKNATILNPI